MIYVYIIMYSLVSCYMACVCYVISDGPDSLMNLMMNL